MLCLLEVTMFSRIFDVKLDKETRKVRLSIRTTENQVTVITCTTADMEALLAAYRAEQDK